MYTETVTVFPSFGFGFKQTNKNGFILKAATMSTKRCDTPETQ